MNRGYDTDQFFNYGNIFDSVQMSSEDMQRLRKLCNLLSTLGYSITALEPKEIIDYVINNRSLIDRLISSDCIQNLKFCTDRKHLSSVDELTSLVSSISQNNNSKQNNPIIDAFMKDIFVKEANSHFRGWILPNGQLIGEYDDRKYISGGRRQGHSALVEIFIDGLKTFNLDMYNSIVQLYDEYLQRQRLYRGTFAFEAFAVDVLGWVQISVVGKSILYSRGEKWQDSIIRPFVCDYNFKIYVKNTGKSYEREFAALYDNIDEIVKLGLENKYTPAL